MKQVTLNSLLSLCMIWKLFGIVTFGFDCMLSTILKTFLFLLYFNKFIKTSAFVLIEVLFIIKESIYELGIKQDQIRISNQIICVVVQWGPVSLQWTLLDKMKPISTSL
jgi:hypothetical protein